ncbi:Rha family transcriptional regulator, partial [Escherichia coli]
MAVNTAIFNDKVSMTSVEIAELVGSQHGNVRISIERLAKRGVIQLPAMQKVENEQSFSQNKFTNAYIFEGEQGKRDSIIVVAQLCPEFTARLVDRWRELEEQVR